jgi:hypothetical protein
MHMLRSCEIAETHWMGQADVVSPAGRHAYRESIELPVSVIQNALEAFRLDEAQSAKGIQGGGVEVETYPIARSAGLAEVV